MKYKIITIMAVAALAAGCGGAQKPVDISKTENKSTLSKFETGTVVEKALSSYVRLPGQLKPFNDVNLFAKINSFVKRINVDRGSVVHKGELLAVLEAPEMMSQLQAANARYLQAQETASASREKYRRLKEAAKEAGAVSPLDLDNAMAKMKADEAVALSEKSNVNSVKDVQDYLNIRAPFDGVIVQRNVSAGALVGPGKSTDQPMLVLQDNKKLRLEVMIPENYVDKVDLKQKVSFVFNAMPGQKYQAYISRSADALGTMRSEAIEIDVHNAKGILKPGMYGEVKIPLLSGAKSLLVPNSAIIQSTERQYVVRIVDGKAVFADIKEGISTNDSTEVFGNLKAGEKVVLHAGDELKEGTNIK
ncbi:MULTISPECIES: efflux RND transporter periplasmic adaptor subunit [unclassified Mucilaginibacter]|uniref:efflux RND transporter periplasmic adaptor subunit n=1 Tax=unclassified Mucilaginibacter TaxID=2617802 RepID=UPI000962BF70|nr:MULTISPECIES: efflux RND transporter periplasmic adaptor subunit [unclassified Mucilaginibacter]OJW18198.1 MAG: efflux transporter periplasmic adaptor subunit [Mucilaginibacter sp. 44-25]PLW89300.1 MAG: efflux RND transporter periplasmic adaptor subunit [Mucilaginibacter sp.]HEK22023.1 efflux RND transporter periplasmic adaptor subunit [Bacteroidota bacterium]